MSKLERWAHIAEIASAITVVLSLLYVGYELRRNTAVSAVDAGQHLAEMAQELNLYANQLDIATIVVKAEKDFSSLTDVERTVFVELVRSHFNLWEHAFYSHNEGILDDPIWAIWNSSYCHEIPAVWFKAFETYSGGTGFLPGFLELQESCRQQR